MMGSLWTMWLMTSHVNKGDFFDSHIDWGDFLKYGLSNGVVSQIGQTINNLSKLNCMFNQMGYVDIYAYLNNNFNWLV